MSRDVSKSTWARFLNSTYCRGRPRQFAFPVQSSEASDSDAVSAQIVGSRAFMFHSAARATRGRFSVLSKPVFGGGRGLPVNQKDHVS